MSPHTPACGCRLTMRDGPRIVYCPLHAAAPGLLATLAELVAAGDDVMTATDDVAMMLRLGAATDAARALLAQIDGAAPVDTRLPAGTSDPRD